MVLAQVKGRSQYVTAIGGDTPAAGTRNLGNPGNARWMGARPPDSEIDRRLPCASRPIRCAVCFAQDLLADPAFCEPLRSDRTPPKGSVFSSHASSSNDSVHQRTFVATVASPRRSETNRPCWTQRSASRTFSIPRWASAIPAAYPSQAAARYDRIAALATSAVTPRIHSLSPLSTNARKSDSLPWWSTL
jgi:hypothetical protein